MYYGARSIRYRQTSQGNNEWDIREKNSRAPLVPTHTCIKLIYVRAIGGLDIQSMRCPHIFLDDMESVALIRNTLLRTCSFIFEPNLFVTTSAKASMRADIAHLFARYREIRPLSFVFALEIKDE